MHYDYIHIYYIIYVYDYIPIHHYGLYTCIQDPHFKSGIQVLDLMTQNLAWEDLLTHLLYKCYLVE